MIEQGLDGFGEAGLRGDVERGLALMIPHVDVRS